MAYTGDKCRGIVKAKLFEPSGSYVFPLMVYADSEDGELITFNITTPIQIKHLIVLKK